MLFRRQLRNARSHRDPAPAGLSPREAQARLERTYRRHRNRWVLPSIVLIWCLAAAYYNLTPASYVSKWTLILPVSNGSSTVSLESIGQTSTTPGQTFGSLTLSPKVIYREIADSEQVRRAAASAMGVDAGDFGRARVRLIDETALMLFQMSGRSPEEAQRKARSLLASFEQQLDTLRRDEADRRAQTVRDSLKLHQASLDVARERIIAFQRATGMLSINQFNEAVSSAELMRRKLTEGRSDLQKQAFQQAVLIDRVGIAPSAAAAGLKLASDPSFAKLAASYADANTTGREHDRVLGPNHPAVAMTQLKMQGALAEIEKIARLGNVDPALDLKRLVLFMNNSHQADLLHSIVTNESTLEGRRQEIAALEQEMARLEPDVARMSRDAARLEYLKKDHLVAEAVFTSAAARLDINRTDLYSSYPLVQILAQPDLPFERSQPQLLLAIVAAFTGTLFILLAWGAAWVRKAFGQKRPKNV